MFQTNSGEVPVARAADPSAAPSASSAPDPSTLPGAGAVPSAAATGATIVGYRATDYRFKVVARGAEPGFEVNGFDDTVLGWGAGTAAFGSGGYCALQSTVATTWPANTDVLVRRHVSLPVGATGVTIGIAVDNDIQVYWNGTLVGSNAHDGCPSLDSFVYAVADGLLLAGDNVLAVRGIDRGDQGLLDITVRGIVGQGVPVEQTFGTGSGLHGPSTTHKEKEPVDTATGNYVTATTDLALPGRGLGFAFTRTYNSLDPAVGPLGPGWRQTYTARLVLEASGAARFIAEDGAQYVFAPDGAGGFVRPAGATSRLLTVPGGYELVRLDQVRYRFDSGGQLVSLADRNGNRLTFAYTAGSLTSIVDTVGRVIILGYDPLSGRLTSLADPTGRSVTYTYDAGGRPATVTDVRGGITRYGYDAAGRLATITDQNGHVLVTNTYGLDGRVIEQLDARGTRSTFAWDSATGTSTYTDARGGRWLDVYGSNILIRRVDPLGATTRYTYDAAFNRTGVTDPRGNTTLMTYDAAGNLLTRTAPAPISSVETFTYNAANDVLTSRDGRSNTTTYTYDAAGNLKTVIGPAPASPLTTVNYDPAGTGLVISMIDPRAKTTSFGYDPQANLTSTTTPLGNVTTMTYDATGRLLTLVDPRGNVAGGDPSLYMTTLTYDQVGRVLTSTDPLGNVTSTVYDPAGNRRSVTDALTRTTTFEYDAANHLTAVVDADQKRTEYGYDQVANLTSRRDANLRSTTYAYDLAQRLVSETRPLNRVWTYEYDANGNVTKVIDPVSAATSSTADFQSIFQYDGLNRVTYTNGFGSDGIGFTYDLNGNRTQTLFGVQPSTYTYDELNRMTAYRRTGGGLDYQYDPAGNLTRRTYTDGTIVDLTYDNDSRMATMVSAGLTTTYGYDPAANLVSTTLPAANGYVETRTYDRSGRLTEVKNQKGAAILSRSTYTLDPVGNRRSLQTTTATITYTYDLLDRLTQACYTVGCAAPGDNFRRYTYDPLGNRLTEARDTGATTYSYDAADQLTATSGPAGVVSYTYDLDGRQTAAGSRTFSWAQPDRLASTTLGSTTTTYSYDGDGLRTLASTGSAASKQTGYDWDPNAGLPQLVAERDGSGTLLRRYRQGLDTVSMDTGGSPSYFHYDGLGSVVNLTSASGVTQWTYAYLPYGGVRTETKNQNQAPLNVLRFSGELLDPTGLYYLRARSYDPGSGRFLSTDPASAGPTDPYVSAYAYANGNPIRYTDPSGRCVQFLAAAGAGAATGPGEAVIGPAALGLFGLCVLFVAVAVETTAQVGMQLYDQAGRTSEFRGTTRREFEKEIRDGGYLPKPGSGRGPHDVFEKPGQPDIKLPRHRDISPRVTKQIRDILGRGDSTAFSSGVLPSSGK